MKLKKIKEEKFKLGNVLILQTDVEGLKRIHLVGPKETGYKTLLIKGANIYEEVKK